MKILKEEIPFLLEHLKKLDRKVILIFLSVAVLQTISWYYTSRRFFRKNLSQFFLHSSFGDLYNFLYWFIGDFITYFVIPIVLIKFLFKERTTDYGLKIGNYKIGLKLSGIFVLFMLIVIWFVSADSSFILTYPQLKMAKDNWVIFLIFELGLLLYMFAWEFIWRGFMLFGLEAKFGYYSIMIQMIPFVILHNGKPQLETFSAILGGIALGILALRTRSFIYGVLVHYSVIFSIDLISILRYKSGQFGIGLNSLFNIFRNLFGV